MYRSNFVFLWVFLNIIYAAISNVVQATRNPLVMNEGFSVLDAMALFIDFIVLFKVFCAFFYIAKWNLRSCCGGTDYSLPEKNAPAPGGRGQEA